MVISNKAKATRKRKSRVGDDTGDSPPTKRKKSYPTATRESANKPVPGDDAMNPSASRDIAASDQLETVYTPGQSEPSSTKDAKGVGMKSTVPTRRQPSRAVSRKTIS